MADSSPGSPSTSSTSSTSDAQMMAKTEGFQPSVATLAAIPPDAREDRGHGTESTCVHGEATSQLPPQEEQDQKLSPAAWIAIHKEISVSAQSSAAASRAAKLPDPAKAPPPVQNAMSVPKPNRKKKRPTQEGQTSGRWTDSEHQAFLLGLQTYGREWKKVAAHIPTRTSAQVRSHAQKYFAKLQRHEDAWTTMQPPHMEGAAVAAATTSSFDEQSGIYQSESMQANVARILAQPESVEAEVEETLRRLRERYRQLQMRLQNRRKRNDESSTVTTISSLQNEELIALSVLQGDLPRGDGSTGSHSLSDEEEQASRDGSSPKKQRTT